MKCCIACSGEIVEDTRIIEHTRLVPDILWWRQFRKEVINREEIIVGYHCKNCGLMYKFKDNENTKK
jgi:hypothetical protein